MVVWDVKQYVLGRKVILLGGSTRLFGIAKQYVLGEKKGEKGTEESVVDVSAIENE